MAETIEEQIAKYLTDVHSIELQATRPARTGQCSPSGSRATAEARRSSRTPRLGGLNLGGFFAAQPDTPAKLAGFAFAFEHLEVGSHSQLAEVGRRAGDEETVRVVERIVTEDRAAAGAIRAQFPAAVAASLEAQGVGAA